ncbi:EAL domain-containing protein [Magnetospirillum sp. UT-4]|uniref:bifunctional diguanylate cyclase/phosphodiesterase n=1 Tax=Magnetospirillum sp. UT-4 TaxID=2681467 RepID=UPI0013816ED3|nr:EAL domain-containing protein [Magnetospirillum sp. UT-4]CAA7624584.1 Signal transduction protein containing a membrane domain, an EAL and a GGDEF domain [Magnetospirillum sp. UT-4]
MTDSEGAIDRATYDELAARAGGLAASLPGFAFQRRMDGDGALSYSHFSDNVTAILGFAPEEMAINAKGCLHVTHWADRDQHLAAIRRSADDLASCIEEFRAVTKSGEVRWLKGASRPRRLADGTVVWDGVLIDVTDGRRAEFRLDMLMEHAADSILVIDEAGTIDTANAAAERLFGYSAEELAGRAFALLLPEADRHPHILSADQASCDDAELCQLGIVGGTAHELVGLRKDGSTFPLELSTSEVRIEGHRLYVAIGRDITTRKATEAALRETEQRLRAIAANMPGMVFQRVLRISGELVYTYVSEGCRAFLGLEPEALMADSQLFLNPLSADERQRFFAQLARSAHAMEPFEEEMMTIGGDGRRRWLRGQSRPTRRDGGDVVWDGVMIDVTDRKVAEQRLSFLAYYDPLTRLPNRTAFLERFAAARERAQQQHLPMAVVSLGIDRFGIINATMGHSIGDQVLIAVADMLQSGLGGDSVMARASGDRFLLLVASQGSKRELADAVERIHVLAQRPVTVGGEEFDISASGGVATFPRDGEDAETLIKNAEAALQRAKGQGPGTLQVFTKEMSDRAAKTLSLQTKLRRALDGGEFIPYFQPQVDLVTGEVVGMEALVRWQSPDLGMVSPGEFIPVAEESGLIDGICEVMLEACARQNMAWQDKGLPKVPVAVNVSGRQFQYARRLITALETTLDQSGLDPRYLEVELTESSAMRDADNAIQVVQTLKDMGIACSIDDFGTGYSSLSVLKRFPISKLKIDRSFVMDVITDPNDAAIVDAIVAMAKALRMKVVAEGVEHVKHLEYLRNVGCDQMQGYLFSRPLPAAEMEQLLAEGRALYQSERQTA